MAINSYSSPTTCFPCETWMHVFSYLVNDRDNINNVVFARLRAVCREFRDWLEDPSFRVHRNLFFVAQSFPSPFREIAVLEKKNHLQRIAVAYAKAGFIETGKKIYELNQTNVIDDRTLITRAEWHFCFERFDEALKALKQMKSPFTYDDRLSTLFDGLCSKIDLESLWDWLRNAKTRMSMQKILKSNFIAQLAAVEKNKSTFNLIVRASIYLTDEWNNLTNDSKDSPLFHATRANCIKVSIEKYRQAKLLGFQSEDLQKKLEQFIELFENSGNFAYGVEISDDEIEIHFEAKSYIEFAIFLYKNNKIEAAHRVAKAVLLLKKQYDANRFSYQTKYNDPRQGQFNRMALPFTLALIEMLHEVGLNDLFQQEYEVILNNQSKLEPEQLALLALFQRKYLQSGFDDTYKLVCENLEKSDWTKMDFEALENHFKLFSEMKKPAHIDTLFLRTFKDLKTHGINKEKLNFLVKHDRWDLVGKLPVEQSNLPQIEIAILKENSNQSVEARKHLQNGAGLLKTFDAYIALALRKV